MEIVHTLKTRGLVLAGTTNKIGLSFGPKSVVLVASRVGFVNEGPLIKGGSSDMNAHFPSVSFTCGPSLHRVTRSYTTGANASLGGNICLNYLKPSCRAPTRVHTFHVLKTSTINVSAIPRMVTTGRYKFGILTFSLVAGVTTKILGRPLDRRRILAANGLGTHRVRGLVSRVLLGL